MLPTPGDVIAPPRPDRAEPPVSALTALVTLTADDSAGPLLVVRPVPVLPAPPVRAALLPAPPPRPDLPEAAAAPLTPVRPVAPRRSVHPAFPVRPGSPVRPGPPGVSEPGGSEADGWGRDGLGPDESGSGGSEAVGRAAAPAGPAALAGHPATPAGPPAAAPPKPQSWRAARRAARRRGEFVEPRGCLYALSQPPLMLFLCVVGGLIGAGAGWDLLAL